MIAGIAIVALIVPIAFVALLPRRWLVRAMLMWLVAPLFAYLAIVIWETVTRAGGGYSFDTYAFGFMMVATLGAIPWLIACGIGFGIGFLLRRFAGHDPQIRPPDQISK